MTMPANAHHTSSHPGEGRMRGFLMTILSVGLLALSAAPAAAQSNVCSGPEPEGGAPCLPIPIEEGALQRFTQPDPCAGWAAQAALPSLAQANAFTPNGYGPYGWARFTQPFGAG